MSQYPKGKSIEKMSQILQFRLWPNTGNIPPNINGKFYTNLKPVNNWEKSGLYQDRKGCIYPTSPWRCYRERGGGDELAP
jgi:hypothetical protein